MTEPQDAPLWKHSAASLHAAYRTGAMTPSLVLESILTRIEKINPTLNLFAHLDTEGARRTAAASDARFAAGEPLGDLDGIPITIKDNIPVAGLPCAWGSNLYKGRIAEADELPVARLRCQGAIILGKTNVSEFTLGRGNLNTLAFGVTRNPWDPGLTPGASTGGGAAAVASGVAPLALGTDGGGSIRRPASHTGLVGLKPSTGRVARINGLPPILHDFEIIGPIARTVEDLAMVLAATEGAHPLDRQSHGFQPGAMREVGTGRRILYVAQLGDMIVEPEVAASCRQAAAQLEDLGHQVEFSENEPFDVALFEKHWPVVGAAGLAWLLKDTDWQGKVGEPYPPMIEKGRSLSAIDYVEALMAYRQVYAQLAARLQEFDFIMTPSAGALPWKAEDYAPPYHRAFTGFVNAAGLPAISIPGPASPNGLPIGFQLIGAFGQDWELLSLARQYERAHPWAHLWPAI
ncbi:amidase [Microvirga zambiensis]|uniref:amidase n=1 Tax=Microvirga zambiensis TaxID=1402137 RepID=UPI00191EC6AA|nr:amidase [Microvirga zambiensis]